MSPPSTNKPTDTNNDNNNNNDPAKTCTTPTRIKVR